MVHLLCFVHDARSRANKLFLQDQVGNILGFVGHRVSVLRLNLVIVGLIINERVWLLYKQVVNRIWPIDKDANLCSRCWGDRDKKSKDPALKELIVQGNLQVNKTQRLYKEMGPD